MRFRSSDLSQHDHVGNVELCLSELIRPDHAITTTSHTLRVPGTDFKIRFFHVKHFKCVKFFKKWANVSPVSPTYMYASIRGAVDLGMVVLV